MINKRKRILPLGFSVLLLLMASGISSSYAQDAPNFAGAWHGKLGEGALELIFQQAGNQVTGLVKINSADVGVIREGTVVGNTLRFTIVRLGRTFGVHTDQYLGIGELVMDKGGKSFTGNVLGAATSGGTFIGR